MSSALKWLADRVGNPVTILNPELDGFGNGGTVLSAVIENSVSQDLYADFALTMQFGAAPTAGYPIELFIVRSIDGTTFDDTTGGAVPANGFGDTFPVRAVTTLQTIVIPMVELPPTSFKILLRNSTGAALATGGVNFLKGFFYKRAVG